MNWFKNLFLTTISILIIVSFIKFFNISYPLDIKITNQSTAKELSVVGEGKIDVIPDTAYVELGILVENEPTVKKAQERIDEISNKIIKNLEELNIPAKNIKTSNYSIYPNYKYENNTSTLAGYNGNTILTVKVKNTEIVSKIISRATDAGANQVHGVRFTIDKPEIYREQARKKAIENAKEQAEKIAKDLNIKLGKITNMTESTPLNNDPQIYEKIPGAFGGGGGGPRIEPGSQSVISIVTLYFEKNR